MSRNAFRDRWRQNGCCVRCGMPCEINKSAKKPYEKCKKHRISEAERSKNRMRIKRESIKRKKLELICIRTLGLSY